VVQEEALDGAVEDHDPDLWSSSMAVTISLSSWTNCGPITLSGGLSNVIRQ
jgi:hypothetical protein